MLTVRLRKKLPDFTLEVDFEWHNGILVVLGPSGAGKTTLLDCLAGLQRPDEGRIDLCGRVLFDSDRGFNLPPHKRGIGYVFQNYALFPHLTVKANVMYGLNRRCKCEVDRYRLSVLEVLEALRITHLQDRYPAQLSGGEQQRVALARALMTEPDLLLLDEPWCALDEGMRAAVREEVVNLQRRWQIPFILVTHDRREAETLGEMIVHLDRGKQRLERPLTAANLHPVEAGGGTSGAEVRSGVCNCRSRVGGAGRVCSAERAGVVYGGGGGGTE